MKIRDALHQENPDKQSLPGRLEMAGDDETLPSEIEGPCEEFHQSLLQTDTMLKKLLAVPAEALDEKLSTLDKARLNLTLCFAVDSLFWAFLTVQGVQPRDHAVKKELDRVRQYMGKLKEIEEKEKKPEQRVNKDAAKRFVRNALWEPADKEGDEESRIKSDKERSGSVNEGEVKNTATRGTEKRKRSRSKEADDQEIVEDSVRSLKKSDKVKQRELTEDYQNDGTTVQTDGLKERGTDESSVKKKRKNSSGANKPVVRKKKQKVHPQ